MAKKAGVITINLQAGTAQMVLDMEKAKASVRDFGTTSRSSMAASSAALRELEGNFANNNRAIARFLGDTLKLGPVLQAAFPIIGGLAFGSMIVETGKKVYDFFENVRLGPQKIANAFRELNAPLRMTNDELQVTNDRLANDIAKLEGRRQNTLKLALDEAKVAADHLEEALARDLTALNKLLKEQGIGRLPSLLGLAASTEDLKKYFGGETGAGGFQGRITGINQEAERKIGSATSTEAKDQARRDRDIALAKAYAEALKLVNDELAKAQTIQAEISNPDWGKRRGGTDQTARIEILKALQANLESQSALPGLETRKEDLTTKKEALEANAENAKLDKPFEDRINALNVQLSQVKGKLDSAGLDEASKTIVKAYGEALKAIQEVNKELEKQHSSLNQSQEELIRSTQLEIAQVEAEAEWKTKLVQTAAAIQDRVRSQELLTAAIGQGFEAQKKASVETQVMGAVGGEHYNDPKWMAQHAGDVGQLRSGFSAEADAKRAGQSASTADKLRTQAELERSLAQVQMQGAEAVRLVTLAYKLREMTMAGATRDEIRAQIDLFNAEQANVASAEIAKIEQKKAAIERLTAAVFQGAEAQRKAALENKYAELAQGGAGPEVIAAQRQADEADHERAIAEEAGKLVTVYQDQLEHLNQLVAAIQKEKEQNGDNLGIEKSLRDLEKERLQILKDQQLAIGTAQSGVRAFFYDMQQQAKTASQIIYETLNSAVDKVSDQFAKLITGQKTNFAKMLQGIGEDMVKETVKSGLQKGLGALGQKLGITKPPIKKPTFNAGDPGHVIVDNMPGSGSSGDQGGSIPPTAGAAPPKVSIPGWLSVLQGIFGGGVGSSGGSGGGSTPDVSSSITYMASGGDVRAGAGYIVGESGPEPFFPGVSGSVMSHALAQRTFGGNRGGDTYHVDARGADLGAEGRIRRGLQMTHASAVSTSVQANHDRARRVPAGR